MEKQLFEDHTELENTKFNPDINWPASLWSIHDKLNSNNDYLLKFQYKLKNSTLLTPQQRFEKQIQSKKLTNSK